MTPVKGGNENGHPRVVVRRDVIERAVDLDTGIEHIHAVQEWPLQVVRRSPTPHRNRRYPSGNRVIQTDAAGNVVEKRRKKRTKRHGHPYMRHSERQKRG